MFTEEQVGNRYMASSIAHAIYASVEEWSDDPETVKKSIDPVILEMVIERELAD